MSNDNSLSDRLRDRLQNGAAQLDVALNEQQLDVLMKFVHLLNKWNKVYNLTAVRTLDGMVDRHILDSMSVLKCIPSIEQASADQKELVDVLDVGSGGGLPVFPLAILRPDLSFLSVETAGKKTRFQQQALVELGLNNVRVHNARIENTFDKATTVISRAFTAPDKFLTAVMHNCVVGTEIIIMLGQKELLPVTLPDGFKLLEVNEVVVPNVESVRHIAICRFEGNNL